MAIKSINFKFNGPITEITNYDSSVTNLGTLINKYSGINPEDNYMGPAKIGMARPMEQSVAIACGYPHIVSVNNDVDLVYLAEISTAAATRRIVMYEYTKSTSTFNWKGFVTITFPVATAHTIKGFRVSRSLYTSGTTAVSGTAVTGTGSSWASDRISVGSRVGFGSTDPNQITTWYEIGTVGSNTSITLTSSAGIIEAGTTYVIEDTILIISTSNATATNGGLFIAKGIRPELFTSVGTTIPAATTVDNIRAVYWLADAPSVTNTISCGSAIQPMTSWVNQTILSLDATGPKVYSYNIRAPLTLLAGKDLTAYNFRTGIQGVTGVISQANNGRVGTLLNGPGSGVESLYFVTTTRVYRADVSTITNSSVSWISDAMVEVPPGGTTTYLTTNVLSSCEIAGDIDRLVVATTGIAGARSYVTQYNTVSNPFDHIFLNDDKQQDQSNADNGGVPHPAILATTMSVWSQAGVLYLARNGTTVALNQIYTLPIGAHQTFAIANNQMLITPKFDVSNSNKLYNVYVKYANKLGTDTFSLPTEPFKTYYRTSGISDNSGSWNELPVFGDLSGVSATEIQFMFIFKILGTTCIPARIFGLSLSYEDNNTDSHYEPSVGNSSVPNRAFAYRQDTLWGSAIPNMRMRLYNAVTGALVIDDNQLSSGFGVFEYSIDGGTNWLAWNSSADLVENYIRYTATSLPAGTRIKAVLTQA